MKKWKLLSKKEKTGERYLVCAVAGDGPPRHVALAFWHDKAWRVVKGDYLVELKHQPTHFLLGEQDLPKEYEPLVPKYKVGTRVRRGLGKGKRFAKILAESDRNTYVIEYEDDAYPKHEIAAWSYFDVVEDKVPEIGPVLPVVENPIHQVSDDPYSGFEIGQEVHITDGRFLGRQGVICFFQKFTEDFGNKHRVGVLLSETNLDEPTEFGSLFSPDMLASL